MFQVERAAHTKVLRLEGHWLQMQTDRRQATVVGGGQQEAAAGAPREMMVPGLDWWWAGRRRDGVGLGISSIIKGFHRVREVESSMISEEATFVLSRSSCAVLCLVASVVSNSLQHYRW